LQPAVELAAKDDADVSQSLAERRPLRAEDVPGQPIQPAEKLPGLKMNVLVPPLELVELLQHRDWNRNVVLVEIEDAAAVVQDHIRVQHEQLGEGSGHNHVASMRKRPGIQCGCIQCTGSSLLHSGK